MNKVNNKATSSKLVYIIPISVAVAGTLFVTGSMFSKMDLPKEAKTESNINVAEIKNLSISNNIEKFDRTQVKAEITIAKTTSRSSTNTRTSTKNQTNKKSETTKSQTKKESTTTSIKDVKISKTMDLTKRTGLSREDFIKLISGVKADTSGFFENNAGKIYDLCEKYSINEIFFCGLISAESGWNIASNHRKTHNYISLMRNGKLISYGSVNEGLEVAAQKLHYNYLTPGGKFYHGKTLAGVKTCFCPSSTWIDLVYGRMKQIF